MMVCSIPGCQKPSANIRGWCSKHYDKWRKYGNPTAGKEYGSGWIVRGYRFIRVNGKNIPEHVSIAENVLGKRLPPQVEIHHVDENRSNNSNDNLVICTRSYHRLLHARMRALSACGNPNWKKCIICKQWGDPANLYVRPQAGAVAYHPPCMNDYNRQRKLNGSK